MTYIFKNYERYYRTILRAGKDFNVLIKWKADFFNNPVRVAIKVSTVVLFVNVSYFHPSLIFEDLSGALCLTPVRF